MGRNRRNRNKTRSRDDERAGSGSDGDSWPKQAPGSSVLFTSSTSTNNAASPRQTNRTAFTFSHSSASTSHSGRFDHNNGQRLQRKWETFDETKETDSTRKGSSVGYHTNRDSSSKSPSPSKRPWKSAATDYNHQPNKFARKQTQKWESHTPPGSKPSPRKGKTTRYSPRKGKKQPPGQVQSRGGSRAGHQYNNTRDKHCTDSSSDGHQSTSSSLEIPGFYYDPEKKKYFKILPTAGNVNVVTKETIARQKAEAQRQKDWQALSSGRGSRSATQTSTTASNKISPIEKMKKVQTIGTVLLGAYQRDEVNTTRMQKVLTYDTVSHLRPAGCAEVFPEQQGMYEKLEHMHQMETSRDHKKILCLWSVRESVIQRLQLVTLREASRTCPGHLSVEFDPSGTTVMQSWSKITNMTWADMPQYPAKKNILYTTMCHTGTAYSLAFIRNLDPGHGDDVHVSDFNLGTRATWTCAWNCSKQQFSVGTEKGCLVIDVNTRRMWQFKTHNSDALAQIFSNEDGGVLMYTGTRRGQILLHDLRSSSTFPTTLMSHKSSLSCLRLSSDETFLYASDFAGKINKWDLRMRKPVISYEGLYNQYTKLPFYLDETESILYGAGQDCYSKVWSVDTGKLILSLPPPCQASRDTIPALQFSTHWAGSPGNAGLIMGMRDKFYLYGSGLEEDGEGSPVKKVLTDRWQHSWISVITTR